MEALQNIMAIVRAALGALIGIGYGLLVGAVTFQLMQLTYDPRYPGAMIPDAAGWARLTAFFAAVMTGFFGALVGIVVGVARAGATRRRRHWREFRPWHVSYAHCFGSSPIIGLG
jgi:hypothetical protein